MSRTTLLLGGAVMLACLGLAVLLFSRFGQTDVGFGARGFEVLSDRAVRVDFEVRKDPADTAVCTVRARDADGAETGQALVRIGPSDQGTVVVRHELATQARANTGEVTGCSLAP